MTSARCLNNSPSNSCANIPALPRQPVLCAHLCCGRLGSFAILFDDTSLSHNARSAAANGHVRLGSATRRWRRQETQATRPSRRPPSSRCCSTHETSEPALHTYYMHVKWGNILHHAAHATVTSCATARGRVGLCPPAPAARRAVVWRCSTTPEGPTSISARHARSRMCRCAHVSFQNAQRQDVRQSVFLRVFDSMRPPPVARCPTAPALPAAAFPAAAPLGRPSARPTRAQPERELASPRRVVHGAQSARLSHGSNGRICLSSLVQYSIPVLSCDNRVII